MTRFFLILFFAALNFLVFGQRYEFGTSLGVANYLGDINRYPSLQNSNGAFGLMGKINFNPYFGMSLNYWTGKISAADSLWEDPIQKARNLHFESKINEVSLLFEFNFFKFVPGTKKYNFTPYFNTGLSYFTFNPRAKYEGTWYNLQPLGTEGQGITTLNNQQPYALNSLAIPFGGGFKWNFLGYSTLGIELSARFSFTDYLDDISGTYVDSRRIERFRGGPAASMADRAPEVGMPLHQPGKQRGTNAMSDWFWFIGLKYTYSIPMKNCPEFK